MSSPLQESKAATTPSLAGLEESDVLCTKDKHLLLTHPGNILFRHHVVENMEAYKQATSRNEKTNISRQIVSHLQSCYGCRFVRYDEESASWVTVSAQTAREKVSHALRFAIRRERTRCQKEARKFPGRRIEKNADDSSEASTTTSITSLQKQQPQSTTTSIASLQKQQPQLLLPNLADATLDPLRMFPSTSSGNGQGSAAELKKSHKNNSNSNGIGRGNGPANKSRIPAAAAAAMVGHEESLGLQWLNDDADAWAKDYGSGDSLSFEDFDGLFAESDLFS